MSTHGLEVSISRNQETAELEVRAGTMTHHFHELQPLDAWFKALSISRATGMIIQIRTTEIHDNIHKALLALGK